MAPAADCCAQEDRLLTVEEALDGLTGAVKPIADIEWVPLGRAAGRVLALDRISPSMVPADDYSAVDGWAVRAGDLSPTGETRLPVGGRIPAGRPLDGPARPGAAYRIFTGALLPAGADMVTGHDAIQKFWTATIASARFWGSAPAFKTSLNALTASA